MFDVDIVPVGAQFIRNDSRQRGADMLAHLGFRNIDQDATIAADLEPDCGRKATARRGARNIGSNFFPTATG